MKKRRHSKQRELILHTIKSTDKHPTAEVVYDVVRKELPNISLGTVYRNLNLLAEDGNIKKMSIDPKNEHFDGRTENHCHFFCNSCGCVKDLDCNLKELLDYGAIIDKGDLISDINISFTGVCYECIKKSKGNDDENV